VHYEGSGRNSGVLTLVTICRSIGLTFEEFDALCQQICSRDSQLIHRETRRSVWTGWEGDRITRAKRDAFITANGGRVFDRVHDGNYGKLTGKKILKLTNMS
jgi:hypothetical protein